VKSWREEEMADAGKKANINGDKRQASVTIVAAWWQIKRGDIKRYPYVTTTVSLASGQRKK